MGIKKKVYYLLTIFEHQVSFQVQMNAYRVIHLKWKILKLSYL